MKRAIESLRREASRLGWPVVFGQDLKHDADTLRRYRPREFGWILYPTGTFLIWHEQSDRWTDAVIRHMADYERQTGKPTRFYWWDGQRLEEVTPEEMRNRLNHLRKMAQEQAA